ncbi:DnaK suppressor protein [Methylomarinovum caldicuralii]|uniref:DnaK suppressor protein n=1 Tax=Methylomarinovum caldicuralii TaxID=438856 RepID=A0AAU9CG68_9GAMM|nr:TraR/DksA family transcriptional regulator [Methylomarinovum caldicuralii]BCX81980.1 DnaK suppressor protein [Methylomarinovum caldicuralii]
MTGPVLTDAQLKEFERLLKQRYRELREEIRQELLRSDNEQFIELAGRVHDPEEASLADLLVDLNLAAIDLHIKELREIDEALIRLYKGTYGICEDCDQPIGLDRLRANPTARRCIQCQEIYEKTHAGVSSPSL